MEVTKDIVLQAWKSEEYRDGLPAEVREQIPAKPTREGGGSLSDEELDAAAGGTAFLTPASPSTPAIGGAAASGLAAGLGIGMSD